MHFYNGFQGSNAEYIQHLHDEITNLKRHLQVSHGCGCPDSDFSSALPLQLSSRTSLSQSSNSFPAPFEDGVRLPAFQSSWPSTNNCPSQLGPNTPSTTVFEESSPPSQTLGSEVHDSDPALPNTLSTPDSEVHSPLISNTSWTNASNSPSSLTSVASLPPLSNPPSPLRPIIALTEKSNGSQLHESSRSLPVPPNDSTFLSDASLPTTQILGDANTGSLAQQSKHGLDLDLAKQPVTKKPKISDKVRTTVNAMLKKSDCEQQSTYPDFMKKVGLHSWEDTRKAFTILTGSNAMYQHCQKLTDKYCWTGVNEESLLHAGNSYMKIMEDSILQARLLPFREIVFGSICVVLRCQGLDEQKVEEMLQTGLRLRKDSQLIYARTRRVVQWVGRLASSLNAREVWPGHFDLLLMLWARPISTYVAMTHYPEGTIELFTKSLKSSQPSWVSKSNASSANSGFNHAEADRNRYLFSIPLLVHYFFKRQINLRAICSALEYGDAYLHQIQVVAKATAERPALSDGNFSPHPVLFPVDTGGSLQSLATFESSGENSPSCATLYPCDGGGSLQPSNFHPLTTSSGDFPSCATVYPCDGGGSLQPAATPLPLNDSGSFQPPMSLQSSTSTVGEFLSDTALFPVQNGGDLQFTAVNCQSSTVSGRDHSIFVTPFPPSDGGNLQPSADFHSFRTSGDAQLSSSAFLVQRGGSLQPPLDFCITTTTSPYNTDRRHSLQASQLYHFDPNENFPPPNTLSQATVEQGSTLTASRQLGNGYATQSSYYTQDPTVQQ